MLSGRGWRATFCPRFPGASLLLFVRSGCLCSSPFCLFCSVLSVFSDFLLHRSSRGGRSSLLHMEEGQRRIRGVITPGAESFLRRIRRCVLSVRGYKRSIEADLVDLASVVEKRGIGTHDIREVVSDRKSSTSCYRRAIIPEEEIPLDIVLFIPISSSLNIFCRICSRRRRTL